jgi:hypothetical protein
MTRVVLAGSVPVWLLLLMTTIGGAPWGADVEGGRVAGAESMQGKTPQWQKIPQVCKQLRAEGWRPRDPLGDGDHETGEARVGGSVNIFLCKLRLPLPARGRGKPSRLELFMQHRGGETLSLKAEVWEAADRAATLDAAATWVTRLLRDLQLPLPADLPVAIRTADPWQDDPANLQFEVSVSKRESAIGQPDLKPEDVPLLEVTISVKPAESDGDD